MIEQRSHCPTIVLSMLQYGDEHTDEAMKIIIRLDYDIGIYVQLPWACMIAALPR